MRKFDNWDEIQEAPDKFERPAPGGYIARIIYVDDDEGKQYLRIEWDFEEGEYKGANAETFNRAGFWPTALIRSYKKTAERFFKSFITSVETSNLGYRFDPKNPKPHTLEGKLMGIVLGEEEYIKGNGDVGKRLYVYQVRSVKAIRDGDFKVPELKRLPAGQAPVPKPSSQFQPVDALDDDDDCPFL